VIVVDLNLLVYAVNRDSARHAAAKAWVEEILSGDEPVGIPWIVVLGFLRLTTNPRVFPKPIRSEQALAIVDDWFARPAVVPLSPTERHWAVLRDLLSDAGTAGNLTTDAHLAALAIENGAELCSTDADFGRFKTLRRRNPLAQTRGVTPSSSASTRSRR
jgi:toxin-antitoxin system PIN domain toxin